MYNYNNICGMQNIYYPSLYFVSQCFSWAWHYQKWCKHSPNKIITVIFFCDKFQKVLLNIFWYEDRWYLKMDGSHLGQLHPLGQKLFQPQDPTLTICEFPNCKTPVPVRESSAVLTADNIWSIILYIYILYLSIFLKYGEICVRQAFDQGGLSAWWRQN